ncbi:hypothetical protein IFR04_011753 [Cadophora malorum]|uniref:Uncharacterized protein n=1 Tax=Cadophora malorum TaxID=108018 RepID=A0A8H7TA67_9HELO|nr:hypothetical protein IFR04_011753 [Cadophora malorum]
MTAAKAHLELADCATLIPSPFVFSISPPALEYDCDAIQNSVAHQNPASTIPPYQPSATVDCPVPAGNSSAEDHQPEAPV